MLKKEKVLGKLKDKASKIKDAAVEETKKLAEEHISSEVREKVQNKVKQALQKEEPVDKPTASDSQSPTAPVEADLRKKSVLQPAKESAVTPDNSAIHRWKPLEDLLGTPLPDWHNLKREANERIHQQQPVGIVRWLEHSLSIGKRHLQKGSKHDLWQGEGILVLQAHPSFFERLLGFLASLFSIFLAPWYALKHGLRAMVQNLAQKLGALFAVFALPVAFIAFLGDVVTLILEFIVSVPRLLLSPFTLVRAFFSMLLQFFARLVARVIWAFLLPQIGKIMSGFKPERIEALQNLLRRRPWIRYMILGFFRQERPNDPEIIPAATVSQLLIAQRGGGFHRGEYLIVVEGEKMAGGFMNRLRSWFRMIIFPFYWERTVHVLRLPKDANAKQTIIDAVSSTLGRQPEHWK